MTSPNPVDQKLGAEVSTSAELLTILRTGKQFRFKLNEACTDYEAVVKETGQKIDKQAADRLVRAGIVVNPPINLQEPHQDGAVYKLSPQFDDDKWSDFLARFSAGSLDFQGISLASTPDVARERQQVANEMLLAAAEILDADGVARALEMGADANAIGTSDRHNGWTPLLRALNHGPKGYDVAKKLLAGGADAKYQLEDSGDTLIFAVSRCGLWSHHTLDAAPLIDLLVSEGADVMNKLPQSNSTALFYAIWRYDGTISVSAVRALLNHGADPSAVALCSYVSNNDDYPQNVLSYFTFMSDRRSDHYPEFIEAIKLVVDAGGKIDPLELDVRDYCCSALASAAKQRDVELTKYFLEKGANTGVSIRGTPLIDSIKKLAQKYPQASEYQTILGDLEKASRARACPRADS
jgi:ankyrin repeat protein